MTSDTLMSYCVTPGCFNPQNPDNSKFCYSCGSKLLLKGRYRSLQPIGKGGFGRTFLAVDEGVPSQTRCVIKQLHIVGQNTFILKKATELFHQEAARLNDLGNHPQIPSLFAHFEQQKQLYLVQEFIDGQNLERELQQQKGTFDETRIWELLADLLPVLKFVHDRKVLHRDIKPENIMRRRSDNKLVLIDFGVAKEITDSALFQTGTAVGSPGYMAPEQTKGKALPASDLYNLGVTCIHLITGIPPLDMFDVIENRWVWRDFLLADTLLSDRLGRILDKMVKPAVSQRYRSVGEVLQAIQAPLPASPQPSKSVPTVANFFTQLWHPLAAKLQGKSLISESGVDYGQLQFLLAAGKWEEADRETRTVICQASGKSPRGYLQIGDIEKLACEDLEIIDRLWVKFSKGHFGLSVQKQIFELVEEDYAQFCARVGWPPQDSHSPYLKFSLSAPAGHLPSRCWVGGYQWWRHAATMASGLHRCQIA